MISGTVLVRQQVLVVVPKVCQSVGISNCRRQNVLAATLRLIIVQLSSLVVCFHLQASKYSSTSAFKSCLAGGFDI